MSKYRDLKNCAHRSASTKLFTMSMIAGLIWQTFLVAPLQGVQGTPKTVSGLAPSEPFVIKTEDAIALAPLKLAANLFSYIPEFVSNIRPAQMPEGLVLPNSPTFSERLFAAAAGTFLAFTAPLVSISRSGFNPDPAPAPPAPPPGVVTFDFDGDGKADVGRWHSANTEFKVKNSSTGSYTTSTIGSSSAVAAPADYDGDGKTDAAVFSAGTWTIKNSSNSLVVTVSGFGQAGDLPFPGNWVGTTTVDEAFYRPSTYTWYFRDGATGTVTSLGYGASGDIPMPGNYDGDAKMDIAVYRPSAGTWYIRLSSTGADSYVSWGSSVDIPVQGDFDGDGKSDPALYRPSTSHWYILRSSTSYGSYIDQSWGSLGDQPTPADYDGDGITDFSIWRPTTGTWWTIKSTGGYDTPTLGVPGDTAVPSAFTKQIAGTATGDVIAAARLDPKNTTGGTNLYSQNFGWGTSLVNLPGRAGLDASLGISYNSLIWTKIGSVMYFDPDKSNVAPGFRVDFPEIEPIYYDATKSLWSYMMVKPDGTRTEFRQTAVTNVYETADSSYAQIAAIGASNPNDPVEDITLKVTTTDGTQMSYIWYLGSYKCTQIKDRNGNYITINYTGDGRLQTITDTLGRVITLDYSAGPLTAITQTWKTGNGDGSNTTHTWASFSYTTKTVAAEFASSLAVVGPPNGTVMTVLDKVTYADNSFTKFTYNGYIQVQEVQNYAADNHELNHTVTNLDYVAASPTDCPRFTQTRNYTQNFNSGAEVTTTNSLTTGATYSLPGSITGSGTRIDVAVSGDPTNLVSRTYVGDSGWKEGLTLATEDCVTTACTGTDRKRWTWKDWLQDYPGVSYITNPRVRENLVGDGTNTKMTTIDYLSQGGSYYITQYGLPTTINVYDVNLTSVLKSQTISYNLTSNYTSRRIIGLPVEVDLWEGSSTAGTLMSKVTFGYDENGYTGSGQSVTPTQHDATYGTSFAYRGNQTSSTRYDVLSQSSAVSSGVKYNTAGSPISKTDPLLHVTNISYTDNFNSSGNPATYAYPTTITDPNSQNTTLQYRYDTGAGVSVTTPVPAGQTLGKTTKRTFDSVGRPDRESVYVGLAEMAYARHVYPINGIQSQSYATLIDTNSSGGPDSADEVYSERWFDGAGRVRQSRTEHPGSTGGWTSVLTSYDVLGRLYAQSVPTETNSVYGLPTGGDDTARGFIYNYTYYDWKGRVIRTIPSDSSGTDGKDTLISYDGCGCAGGQITTVQGPSVPRDDQPTVNARRTQKIYADILGREYKTETLNWDGSVYSTVKKTLNGRDQATLVRQYAGTDSGGTYQDYTATFDGHGRLKTTHKPEQSSGTNATYNYNADDSISSVTDARGAVTNYTYNTRGLVTNIGWTIPFGSGIADPADTAFSYDNAGNRTAMTDGLGSIAYAYDSLSEMTAETRTFSDTLADKPTGNFHIGYTYNIGGQLKSYTDPYGQEIDYTQDKAGRVNTVTGSSFGGVATYANNSTFRAWGAVKHVDYGSGYKADVTYNNTLQPATYSLDNPSDSNPALLSKSYDYYADGRLKLADENSTTVGNNFDRSFTFDQAGRTIDAKSGAEAHGTTETNLTKLPYRQTYSYTAFDNTKERTSTLWDSSSGWNFSYTYSNNRVSGGTYDTDGRQTIGENINFEYDGSGKMSRTWRDLRYETVLSMDGLGNEGKRAQRIWTVPDDSSSSWGTWDARYFIYSTVLGRNVSEASSTGKKRRTYVVAGGTEIARQAIDEGSATEHVGWQHRDPSGLSSRTTYVSGDTGSTEAEASDELDALGNNVGLFHPLTWTQPMKPALSGSNPIPFSNVNEADVEQDGILMPGSLGQAALRLLSNGGALPSALAQYQNTPGFTFQSQGLGLYTVTIAGSNYASPPNGDGSGAYGTRDTTFGFSLPHADVSMTPQQRGPAVSEGATDTFECQTLADLIASPTFKDAADRAWDRSFEHGFKNEQGANFYFNANSTSGPGFSSSDRRRDSRSSTTMPFEPDRAKEVARSNGISWFADLHSHPFRHNESIPGIGIAQTPWIASPDDLKISESSGIAHIILYPNMKSYNYFVIKNGAVFEQKDWKNYSICATRKGD